MRKSGDVEMVWGSCHLSKPAFRRLLQLHWDSSGPVTEQSAGISPGIQRAVSKLNALLHLESFS